MDGAHGLPGWQWLYILEGLPAVVLGLIVWRHLDDEIDHATWLSPAEKQYWSRKVDQDARVAETHHFGAALREPATYTLSLIYMCLAAGIYGLVFWMPQLIKTAGTQDTFTIGLISALPYGVAGIALINSIGQLGGIISPYMVGKVRDATGSATLGLYAISAACVIAFALIAWGLPKRLSAGPA